MDLYLFDDGGFVTVAESADEALTKLRAECQRIGFKETTILEISQTMQQCKRPVFVRWTRSSALVTDPSGSPLPTPARVQDLMQADQSDMK